MVSNPLGTYAGAWGVLVEAAEQRRKMTYGQLAAKNGGIARGLGPTLRAIESACAAIGAPALSALLVRASDGQPSSGYGGPSDLADVYRAVFSYDWRRVRNPFV
jgi:hypothetical protein